MPHTTQETLNTARIMKPQQQGMVAVETSLSCIPWPSPLGRAAYRPLAVGPLRVRLARVPASRPRCVVARPAEDKSKRLQNSNFNSAYSTTRCNKVSATVRHTAWSCIQRHKPARVDIILVWSQQRGCNPTHTHTCSNTQGHIDQRE